MAKKTMLINVVSSQYLDQIISTSYWIVWTGQAWRFIQDPDTSESGWKWTIIRQWIFCLKLIVSPPPAIKHGKRQALVKEGNNVNMLLWNCNVSLLVRVNKPRDHRTFFVDCLGFLHLKTKQDLTSPNQNMVKSICLLVESLFLFFNDALLCFGLPPFLLVRIAILLDLFPAFENCFLMWFGFIPDNVSLWSANSGLLNTGRAVTPRKGWCPAKTLTHN